MGCELCKKVKHRNAHRERVYNLSGALKGLKSEARRAHVSCYLALVKRLEKTAQKQGLLLDDYINGLGQ